MVVEVAEVDVVEVGVVEGCVEVVEGATGFGVAARSITTPTASSGVGCPSG